MDSPRTFHGTVHGKSTDCPADIPRTVHGTKRTSGRKTRSFCCLCPSVLSLDHPLPRRRRALAPAVALLPFQHTAAGCCRPVLFVQHDPGGVLGGCVPHPLGRRPRSGIAAECSLHYSVLLSQIAINRREGQGGRLVISQPYRTEPLKRCP